MVRFRDAATIVQGARVIVAPLDGVGPARTVSVDQARHPTVVVGLEAGRYRVSVVLDRSAPVETDVRLAPGDWTELVVASAPPGGRTTVDERVRYRGWSGPILEREEWQLLPVGPLVWSLLETTDATGISDRVDAGGLAPAEPPRFAWHGTSWRETRLRVGGVDVTDPMGGATLVAPQTRFVEQVAAVTAGGPVEVGGPGAAVVVHVVRPPGRWRREASSAWGPSSRGPQRAEATPPPVARLRAFADGGFVVGGPLRARVALVAAASATAARRIEPISPARLRSRIVGTLVRVSAATATTHAIELVGAGQWRAAPFAGRALLDPPISTEQASALHTLATLRRTIGGAAWALGGGYARHDAEADSGVVGGTLERLRDGPLAELPLPGRRLGERGQVDTTIWFAPRWVGRVLHEGRVGASVMLARARDAWSTPPAIGERIGEMAAFAWRAPGQGESVRGINETTLFAADRLRVGETWLVEGGVRIDRTVGWARGAEGGIAWTTMVPRVAVRWGPPSWRGAGLVATYGRFVSPLLARHLAWGDPGSPRWERFLWHDTNADGRVQPAEIGPLVALSGPGAPVGSLDPHLAPPITAETTVGVDLAAGPRWRIAFTGIRRRQAPLVAPVDLGVPAGRYRMRLLFDPGGDLARPEDDQMLPVWERPAELLGQDRYRLTNLPDQHSLHEGLELRVMRTAPRLSLAAGATASRSVGPASYVGFGPSENDHGLAGDVVASPNATTFARGRLFFDRAYTVTLTGQLRAPRDVDIGLVARYWDGQPFARLVVVPDLPQGPELVRAVPNGRHRFSYLLTIDVRIAKIVSVGRARAAVGVDVFNLLDSARGVAEEVLTGPTFRRVVAVQPPRSMRVALRVEF